MAKIEYSFSEDEFDAAGRSRHPEGVHRATRPRWRVLLPFVIVVLLAPVLAYVGVSYLAGQDDPAGTSVTASPTDEAGAQAQDAEGSEPARVEQERAAEPDPSEPKPSGEPSAESPAIDRGVAVLALNGTGTSGLAGGAAGRLRDDGFTAVTIGNARSSVPTASTVYYHDGDLAAPAQRVAEVLGIGRVAENASATPSIAVVLRSDYRP